MRSLIDIVDFSVEELDELLQLLHGKIHNIDETSHCFAPFTAR